MPRTTSSRKRQSRLEFSPLPSSSPAAKHLNRQIQDRAAAVTIQGSSKVARRNAQLLADSDSDDAPSPNVAITPSNAYEDSDSEPARVRPTRGEPSSSTSAKPAPRSSRKARQQRLDFGNVRQSGTFDPPGGLSSSRSAPTGKGVFASAGRSKMVELSSDSDSDLPSARKLTARSRFGGQGAEKKQRVTRGSQRPVVLSDSEQEGIVVAGQNKALDDDESSGEDMPTTQGRLPRKRKRRTSVDSFLSDSPPQPPESDDEVVEARSSKRKRARRVGDEDEDQENGEEQLVKTPRRRLAKRQRQLSQREKDDLAEDLADLGSSSEAASSPRPPPRTTQSAEKNARQKALEKLKLKRGRNLETVSEVTEDAAADEDHSGIEEVSGDDSEVEEIAPPLSSYQMFQPDENDEEFLVDEGDDDPLGIPEGIPLQFTRYGSMKGRELFKFAILWMVQKKINPAFDMRAEIYGLTFRKLDDEVRGLAASKFTSSAWTPEFTIALQARPEIHYQRSGVALKDKCDACNRSQHPATYEVQFQGKPYSRETLDAIEDDDDDSDSSEGEEEDQGDSPDYDAQGHQVVPENTIFCCGKFCTANVITAHALVHWKYQLYDVVVAWLNHAGYLKPEKIVKRDRLSTRKRTKQAHKILRRLEEAGEMKSLWKTFRDSIDQARDSKMQNRWSVDSP